MRLKRRMRLKPLKYLKYVSGRGLGFNSCAICDFWVMSYHMEQDRECRHSDLLAWGW